MSSIVFSIPFVGIRGSAPTEKRVGILDYSRFFRNFSRTFSSDSANRGCLCDTVRAGILVFHRFPSFLSRSKRLLTPRLVLDLVSLLHRLQKPGLQRLAEIVARPAPPAPTQPPARTPPQRRPLQNCTAITDFFATA